MDKFAFLERGRFRHFFVRKKVNPIQCAFARLPENIRFRKVAAHRWRDAGEIVPNGKTRFVEVADLREKRHVIHCRFSQRGSRFIPENGAISCPCDRRFKTRQIARYPCSPPPIVFKIKGVKNDGTKPVTPPHERNKHASERRFPALGTANDYAQRFLSLFDFFDHDPASSGLAFSRISRILAQT
ncbi:hypothetical protein [Geminisphaera colitermitum]|uniref:hypothetical protein n=1 Tax=Geminisphaera colitermitum TaxID=1148786 RepID=UPI0012FF3579|nr:hypothetical protein [Geminisphaera colitermitum]